MDRTISTSKPLAPEDIRPGDYVALLREVWEILNFGALLDPYVKRELIMRAWTTPCDAGRPLRVLAVCIPFVLVEDGDEKHCTLDLRRHEVARLSEEYARKAMKRLRRGRDS